MSGKKKISGFFKSLMFDNFQRQARSLDGSTVSVTLLSDDDGYFDRSCPGQHCHFVFKILHEDWKNIVRDDEMFCPLCRFSSPSKNWSTPQQVEYAKSVVAKQIKSRLRHAMRT